MPRSRDARPILRSYLCLSLLVATGCETNQPTPAPHRAAPARPSARVVEYDYPFKDPTLTPEARAKDLVSRLTPSEKVTQLMHAAPAIERLGVVEYDWWNEALHGVARSGRATVFPQAIGLAASFDPELLERVASAIADEARAKFNGARKLKNRGRYAGLTFWSPNINILRDPRWGRGQETYGEDPYLTSRMGVAFVRGLQGNHPRFLKTAACAKHFAVHSGPEALRHEFDARPSRKDLFETYLPAFEALVREAKVEAVMTAYNRLYGEPCSSSGFLIGELLRRRWGFRGHVLSDCWAVSDIHKHHKVTESARASAARALSAGLDLNCGDTFTELMPALEASMIKESELDRALTRLMLTRIKLGLFDPPGSVPFDKLAPEVVSSDNHQELARRAAQQSIVLLKNAERTLPLDGPIKRLMLLGPYVADGHVLLGNYFGGAAELTTLYEGVMASVPVGASVEYKDAFLAGRQNLNPIDWATGAAHEHDAIVLTLGLSGRIEGEEGAAHESEFKGDRKDIELPQHQLDYLKKLRAAGDTKIVVVLFGGSAFAMPEVHELADAILLAWYPGQAGGRALADIIFGKAAPGGRLPVSFPASTKDLPAFDDYSMQGRTYRYAEKQPLYPFGFGLSYANVEYESLRLGRSSIRAGEEQQVIVRLKNQSQRHTAEVVQIYLSDVEASVPVPRASLVAFERVLLKPGELRSLELAIPAGAMRTVTENGERRFEPGRFVVHAGSASPGERAVELGAPPSLAQSFELTQ